MTPSPAKRRRARAPADVLGELWNFSSRRFAPVAKEVAAATRWLVLDPAAYGARWHARFRAAYPLRARPLLVCGLNPGPYGMAQSGVPFTDLKRLRACLPRLAADLQRRGEPLDLPGLAPRALRPFLTRTFESSSVRVYRFLDLAYGSAERGFRDLVVVNPCPLLLIDPVERANRTPADLPRALRAGLDAARHDVVMRAVDRLAPRAVILFGRDVATELGDTLRARLGARAVVEWEHPARAVPDAWSRGLAGALRRRGLLAPRRD